MARSRKGFLNSLTVLPWYVGFAVGIVFFAAITWGFPWWLSGRPGMVGQGLASAAGKLSFLAWFLLIGCWAAAGVSWLEARKTRRLLDTRSDLESLAAPGWHQFEQLVGEAFRRNGYSVAETGLGADGGIDLVLGKDGKRVLVQCKQWRRQRVDVKTVREMFGLLAHHNADAVKIVALGRYTADAERFAAGKPIELIDGETLLAMIRSVQSPSHAVPASLPNPAPPPRVVIQPKAKTRASGTAPGAVAAGNPPCPRCGQATVRRRNRQNDQAFFGCTQFPRCRGTVQAG